VFGRSIKYDSAHVSLIPSHTHDLHGEVPEGRGGNKAYEVYENLNEQIVTTSYLNDS
jgi:hypothetical protein